MAIIGTNDTATVRVSTPPVGVTYQNIVDANTLGGVAASNYARVDQNTTFSDANTLGGVAASNYARVDQNTTFSNVIYNFTNGVNFSTQIAPGYIEIAGSGVSLIDFKNNVAEDFDHRFISNGTNLNTECAVGDFLIKGNLAWHAGNDVRHRSFTVGTVPSAASSGAGTMIYVSNESGGAVPAFSDGTNWRRVTDRAIIS